MIKKTAAPVVSEINVTPMVDVMLVVLIIIMVITPLLSKSVPLDMAKARTDYGNMLAQPPSVFISPTQFRDDPAAGTHHSATGVRGDPSLATVEKGRVILADTIAELVAGLRPLCP